MIVLALVAAQAQSDGGVGLQQLLRKAHFNERARLSINKKDPLPAVHAA